MTRPATTAVGARRTVLDFMKSDRKLAMATAYDATFAALVDVAGVDGILVGDSLAPLVYGARTTLPATIGQMIAHGRAVVNATRSALVVVDLPFLSYQVSRGQGVRNAGRILKLTGAGAVKLEGGRTVARTVRAIVDAGIPIMGHIGLTPQSHHVLGGFTIQGEGAARQRLIDDAVALQDAGAFAIVLEFIRPDLAAQITESVSIPTLGVGAGVECDGQIMVTHDVLGLNDAFAPLGLGRAADLGTEIRTVVARTAKRIREGKSLAP